MHFSTVTGAAALLALAPFTLAVGTATVVNNCGMPIYFASVGQSASADMQQLQGSYSQQYTQEGDGISIKLSPNDSLSGAISQFEFTWANGKINYDISNINGYPFSAEGMSIVPSMQNDPNNPTCVPIECPAGQSVCSAAYNAPEDTRTMVCDQNSDLTLTMCPGSSSSKRSADPGSISHIHQRVHARHLPRRA